MGDALISRYWCHMCSQMVDPIMEVEIKCPFCESGFVEEMDNRQDQDDDDSDVGSDRALSLWAPILLGMMGGPRRRRFRRDENDDDAQQGERDLERDLESILRRRRRRSSAAILHLLQGLRGETTSESENSESNRDRERVILINPFNQAIILQGSFDVNQTENQSQNTPGSLGDYFIGSGLDLLLQHLAENDPNRYGTPPAQKEAVEAMPTITIKENLQCSVCLDDFEIGAEARQMPCKHKFHAGCILPWLELHSSCPVCRFQLPADESKLETNGSANSSNRAENSEGYGSGGEGGGDRRNENGRRSWGPFPWPFNGLFSLSGSQNGGDSSSRPSSSSSSAAAPEGGSHSDDN